MAKSPRMKTYKDLKNFFDNQTSKMIIVADAEPVIHKIKNGKMIEQIPGGGVAVALDPIARASGGTYIARAKSDIEKQTTDKNGKLFIGVPGNGYTLRRLFIDQKDVDSYYLGFSNQTLWPLCHVTFEKPEFRKDWFDGYKKINQKFAQAIKEEIKGKTFVWIHDYQLCLVPKYLEKPKDTIIAMFWHIPWPTWEIFRILPGKKEILESMLQCNFLAFHRGYQARNFLETVRREFQVRIDEETSTIYYNNNKTVVRNLPLGIDTDVIRDILSEESNQKPDAFLQKVSKQLVQADLKNTTKAADEEKRINAFFEQQQILLGVDRLDYTKGLILRLRGIDKFFEKNQAYRGKVTYIGIIALSREAIPSYQALKKEFKAYVIDINKKYQTKNWKPIHVIFDIFPRKELLRFYQKASVCLVTPRDDGMNLVSKEFVIANSLSKNPGMLVLSQFAGSSIDLTQAVIVNPYDIEELAAAIKKAIEMNLKEKITRMSAMTETLDEHNAYVWAEDFVRYALSSR